MMGAPVRLQLSRRKGFDLQALSLATNGLPAVNVTRGGAERGKWGNPFKIEDGGSVRFGVRDLRTGGWYHGPTLTYQAAARVAVNLFRAAIAPTLSCATLRGKNLACTCFTDDPCHADVLLDHANVSPQPKDPQHG